MIKLKHRKPINEGIEGDIFHTKYRDKYGNVCSIDNAVFNLQMNDGSYIFLNMPTIRSLVMDVGWNNFVNKYAPELAHITINPIWTFEVQTMATDGMNIFMNPVFTLGLLEKGGWNEALNKTDVYNANGGVAVVWQLRKENSEIYKSRYAVFVLCHEIYHMLYQHHKRERIHGCQNHYLANLTEDLEINRDILHKYYRVFGKGADLEKLLTDIAPMWYKDEQWVNPNTKRPYEDELFEEIYDDFLKNGKYPKDDQIKNNKPDKEKIPVKVVIEDDDDTTPPPPPPPGGWPPPPPPRPGEEVHVKIGKNQKGGGNNDQDWELDPTEIEDRRKNKNNMNGDGYDDDENGIESAEDRKRMGRQEDMRNGGNGRGQYDDQDQNDGDDQNGNGGNGGNGRNQNQNGREDGNGGNGGNDGQNQNGREGGNGGNGRNQNQNGREDGNGGNGGNGQDRNGNDQNGNGGNGQDRNGNDQNGNGGNGQPDNGYNIIKESDVTKNQIANDHDILSEAEAKRIIEQARREILDPTEAIKGGDVELENRVIAGDVKNRLENASGQSAPGATTRLLGVLNRIAQLLKPAVNWKSQLRKHLNQAAIDPLETDNTYDESKFGAQKGEIMYDTKYRKSREIGDYVPNGVSQVFWLVDASDSMNGVRTKDGKSVFDKIFGEVFHVCKQVSIHNAAAASFAGGHIDKRDVMRFDENDLSKPSYMMQAMRRIIDKGGGTDAAAAFASVCDLKDPRIYDRKETLMIIVSDGDISIEMIAAYCREKRINLGKIVIMIYNQDRSTLERIRTLYDNTAFARFKDNLILIDSSKL